MVEPHQMWYRDLDKFIVERDSIGELKYLDLIIKESLRLYPTIPLFPRIAKDDCQLGEFEVKKGTDILRFSDPKYL